MHDLQVFIDKPIMVVTNDGRILVVIISVESLVGFNPVFSSLGPVEWIRSSHECDPDKFPRTDILSRLWRQCSPIGPLHHPRGQHVSWRDFKKMFFI